jgi:endonuclease III
MTPDRLLQQILLVPNVVEDRLHTTGWRMLVGCILLNQTGRKQVDRVWPDLFRSWPDAPAWCAGAARQPDEQLALLRPLGFGKRRHRTITDMSQAWMTRGLGWSVTDLPGCGAYAQASWDIFVNQLRPPDIDEPEDKELRAFLQRERGAAERAA